MCAQEEAFAEDSLAQGRVQAGDSQKGASSIVVRMVRKWNASQMQATGKEWVKAVEVAFSNHWASEEGQARKAEMRVSRSMTVCHYSHGNMTMNSHTATSRYSI